MIFLSLLQFAEWNSCVHRRKC